MQSLSNVCLKIFLLICKRDIYIKKVYKKFFKRAFDIIFSLVCILFFSPLIIICFLCVLIFDGRPVIFKQARVGKKENIFTLYKFRTMPKETKNIQSSHASKIQIKLYGKFLRRFNLDELPQLFNILKGDMSVVGPRPALISQLKLNKLRKDMSINLQKPGLTGLAQINSFDNMSDEVKAEYDKNYCLNINFYTDFIIIIKTFKYFFKKNPIY